MSFSETASNALRVALMIADTNNAKIHVIHVIKPIEAAEYTYIRQKVAEMLKATVDSAIKNLAQSECEKKDLITIPINFEVKAGTIGKTIEAFEREFEIDLTIIGTHGIMSLKEMIAGTTAMKILKHTSCPALTVPREFKKHTIKSVLYPIRNTDGYATKLDYLFPFVMKSKLRIHLLAILNSRKIEDAAIIEGKLKEVRDTIYVKEIEVTYEMQTSESVPRSIVGTSEKLDADLIVINATINKRKWYKIFTSYTFTNRMVNDSKTPILCVKPQLLKQQ